MPLRVLAVLVVAFVLSASPASAQVTAVDMAAAHTEHGHHQWRGGEGTEGHTWAEYRREARQVNRYLRAAARAKIAACSREPHCAVQLASFLTHAPYSLVDAIVRCESGYRADARNPSSTAGGLLQYLSSTWDGVAPIYGMAGHSRFEVWPAAWVGANHIARGGPSPWNASRGCWG